MDSSILQLIARKVTRNVQAFLEPDKLYDHLSLGLQLSHVIIGSRNAIDSTVTKTYWNGMEVQTHTRPTGYGITISRTTTEATTDSNIRTTLTAPRPHYRLSSVSQHSDTTNGITSS